MFDLTEDTATPFVSSPFASICGLEGDLTADFKGGLLSKRGDKRLKVFGDFKADLAAGKGK